MDLEHFKEKLLEEKQILTEEINAIGVLRVSSGDYRAKAETGVDTAEDMALADMFEVEQTKDAVLDQLENRLMNVERALNKISEGIYGICEVSGEQIEEARLEANPAARTNIANRETVLD
jgi:RNA polymerase-binding transcription factor DksA